MIVDFQAFDDMEASPGQSWRSPLDPVAELILAFVSCLLLGRQAEHQRILRQSAVLRHSMEETPTMGFSVDCEATADALKGLAKAQEEAQRKNNGVNEADGMKKKDGANQPDVLGQNEGGGKTPDGMSDEDKEILSVTLRSDEDMEKIAKLGSHDEEKLKSGKA